ncbi:MAG: oligoendopeptidase F, partial [Firmicutes bacterium]|nr:oligoendopeptidase F [Bacillota bacterium]
MEIKERNLIEEQYKWDITTLFASDEAWEEALMALPAEAEKVSAYQGRLGESAAVLRAFFDAEEALDRKMENVYCYASLRSSEDTRAEAGQVMTSKAMGLFSQISAALSFAQPEILAIPEEKFAAYLASEELAPYRHALDDLARTKAHTLSKEEEKILSGMGEIRHAPGEIANMLMDADMKFDPVVLEDGSELPLSGSNYIFLQSDTRREVREKSFKNYYKGFKNHINTFAAAYGSNVKADVFTARTRHYESARAMSMAGENIPASVYDSLVETVHKYLPAMYRYVELRKKMLGVDELHYYDVYAPLVGDLSISYTYEQAKEMVKKAVAPLGEDYVKTVQRGFDERWIDVYP